MKRIFLDMDGTLARFNVPHALDRFEKERKFFAELKAYTGIEAINELCKTYKYDVYIVSVSPHGWADSAKIDWIRKYLPDMVLRNVIFCRPSEKKGEEVEARLNIKLDEDCFLLDDYTANLQEWENMGGTGIKRITYCADNSTKKWKGLELKDLKKLEKLVF